MRTQWSGYCYFLLAFIPFPETIQLPSLTPTAIPHAHEIPPTEDLMREHGILERLLLIYEKIIKKIDDTTFQKTHLTKALDLMKSFIQDYHEKLEEEYIFPLFEKQQKEVALIKTLRQQHSKGREITAQLRTLLSLKSTLSPYVKDEIKNLLQKYITMYRPHHAREDTVLFPQLRTFVSQAALKELGAQFEKKEHELFGDEGFQSILKKVANLEKTLGIYRLSQFTSSVS